MFAVTARTALRAATKVPRAAAAGSSRAYSSVHENDPEVLGTEKARNLSNVQHKTSTTHDHAPGWNEYLASSSEAAVKADQADGVDPAAMQQRTVEHIKQRHHTPANGPTPQPQTQKLEGAPGANVEAVYEREEVSGPLGGAGQAQEIHEIYEREVVKEK